MRRSIHSERDFLNLQGERVNGRIFLLSHQPSLISIEVNRNTCFKTSVKIIKRTNNSATWSGVPSYYIHKNATQDWRIPPTQVPVTVEIIRGNLRHSEFNKQAIRNKSYSPKSGLFARILVSFATWSASYASPVFFGFLPCMPLPLGILVKCSSLCEASWRRKLFDTAKRTRPCRPWASFVRPPLHRDALPLHCQFSHFHRRRRR